MVSLADAAKRLGISRQAIGQWSHRVGAPTVLDSRGRRVPLWPDFPRWREQELVKGEVERALAATRPKTPNSAVPSQEERKATADARLAEIKVAQLEGALISPTSALEEIQRFCARTRGPVRSMKTKYAADLVGLPDHASAVRALDRISNAVLLEMQAEARLNAAAA